MLPITKVILALTAAFFVTVFTVTSHDGKRSSNRNCVGYCIPLDAQLIRTAQQALAAIKCKREPTPSYERANRGQHVFNNGLLGFHRSVLQDLLREVGGYDEQLNNLMQDLIIPLSRTEQNAISTWVAHFSLGDRYLDYNADVFGEYVRQLRGALVEYLKAETSVDQNGRDGIQDMRRRVRHIASEMANREVYVDPMARDRWLHENQNRVQEYEQVRRALRNMFQDILQDFQKVSDKIKDFRRT